MTRESGTGGPSWVGAPQGVPRPPGPQGVGHDPRLTLAFGIADVVAPAPTTYLGGSGVGLRPGLRTPFGPSGSGLAEGDQLYLATGYRRTWGAPGRIEGYEWNPVRAVYEPTMVGGPPANQGVRALRDQAFALAQQGVFLQALPDESATSGWLYRWVRTFGDFPSTAKPYALYATLEAMQPRQPSEVPVDPEIAAAMEGKTGLAAAEARKAVVDARLSHQLREIQVQTPEEREVAFQAERVRQRRAVSSLSGSTEADYSYEAWLRDPTFAGEIPGGAHLGVNYLQPAVDKIKADRKKQGLPDLPPPQFTGFGGIKARRAEKARRDRNRAAQQAEDAQEKRNRSELKKQLARQAELDAELEALDGLGSGDKSNDSERRAALVREAQKVQAKVYALDDDNNDIMERRLARQRGEEPPPRTRTNTLWVGVMPAGTPMWNSKSWFTRTIKDEPMSAWVTPRPRKKEKKPEDENAQRPIKEHSVPSLLHLTEPQARARAAAQSFSLSVADEPRDPGDKVQWQRPAAYTWLAVGGNITVGFSTPAEGAPPEPAPSPRTAQQEEDQPGDSRYAVKVTVPGVVGLTVSAATARLTSEGFEAALPPDAMSTARVLSQFPAGGTLAREGATVALVAEKEQKAARPGMPPDARETITVARDTVAVPDVHGLSLADAQRRLAGVHLTGIPSGPHKDLPGAVVSTQDPRAGTLVRRGADVRLTAWAPTAGDQRTQPPRAGDTVETHRVAVPNVVGLLPAQAVATLLREGLYGYFATQRHATWPVTKQVPEAGTPVARGSRVDLWAELRRVDPGLLPPPGVQPAEDRRGQFLIPDVIGMTLADARKALGPLQRIELTAEQMQLPINDTDTVATQDPTGPQWVDAPAIVVVSVRATDRYGRARVGEEKDVPRVIGMTVESARDVLFDAGFVPVVTHTEAPGATVKSQVPDSEPGQSRPKRRTGTIVTISPQAPTPQQAAAALAKRARERAARDSVTVGTDSRRSVLGWAPMARVVEEEERRAREREELRVKTHDACAELTATARRKLAEADVALQALANVETFIADSGEATMQTALTRIVKETRARVNQAASDLWYVTLQAEVRNRDSDGPPCDPHQLRLSINKLDGSGALINPVLYAVRNFAEGAQMHEAFDAAVGTALLAIATGGLSIAAVGATVWTIGSAVTSTAAAAGTTFLAKRRIGQSAMQAGMEAIEAIVKIEDILGNSTTVDDNDVQQIYAHAKSIADEAKEHVARTQEDRDWIEGAGGAWDKLLNNVAAPFLIRDIVKLVGQGATVAWQKFFAAGGASKPTGFLLRRNLTTGLIEPEHASKVPAAVRSTAQQARLAEELVEQIEKLRAADALARRGAQAGSRVADVVGDLTRPAVRAPGLPEPPQGGPLASADLPPRQRVGPPVGTGGAPRGGGSIDLPSSATPDVPASTAAPPKASAPQGTQPPTSRVSEPPGQVSKPSSTVESVPPTVPASKPTQPSAPSSPKQPPTSRPPLGIAPVPRLQWPHGIPPEEGRRLAELVRRQYGLKPFPSKNVAIAEALIDGQHTSMRAISGHTPFQGTVPLPKAPRFKPTVVDGYLRDTDTEYRILEDLASRLRPDSKGIVNLYTERAACASCGGRGGIIEQFEAAFPGVKVQLTTSNL